MRMFKTKENSIILTTDDKKTGWCYVGGNRFKRMRFSVDDLTASTSPAFLTEEAPLSERSLYEGNTLNQLVRVYYLDYRKMVLDRNDAFLDTPIRGSVAVFLEDFEKFSGLVTVLETHLYGSHKNKFGGWEFFSVSNEEEWKERLSTKIEKVNGKMTREKAMYLIRDAIDWRGGLDLLLDYVVMAE